MHSNLELSKPRIPTRIKPQPFLKWAGGKSSLISQLEGLFPKEYRQFHEPFLGGAAVFFHLDPGRAFLSDINPRLVKCYRSIRNDLGGVIRLLEQLRARHNEGHYYDARRRLNHATSLSSTEIAALQIYLNKTCYNGLYRENKKGHFNVPIGSYRNPSVFSRGNLEAVSQRLRASEISCQPFNLVLDRASEGDFVYFDPPYDPISKTSNFVAFSKNGFGDEDQAKLAEVFQKLHKRGCQVMLSNSNTPLIRRLYKHFRFDRVRARRSINSKASRRGTVEELVVRNYS
jgi:DNA adenine methylase